MQQMRCAGLVLVECLYAPMNSCMGKSPSGCQVVAVSAGSHETGLTKWDHCSALDAASSTLGCLQGTYAVLRMFVAILVGAVPEIVWHYSEQPLQPTRPACCILTVCSVQWSVLQPLNVQHLVSSCCQPCSCTTIASCHRPRPNCIVSHLLATCCL